METITSSENKLIKESMALHNKKQRHKVKKFLLESSRGIEEALIYGFLPELVLLREKTHLPSFLADINVKINVVSEKVFAKISTTENSQGIIGVFPFIDIKTSQLLKMKKLVFLDGIQDPGNLGTIIRSAAAFGVDGLLLGPGTVDVYNDKVLRSTLGGIFALPISVIKTEELNLFKKHGFTVIGASLEGEDLSGFHFPDKFIVGIGNENTGLSLDFNKYSDRDITIKINNKMESLNASVAASIIMYEFNR